MAQGHITQHCPLSWRLGRCVHVLACDQLPQSALGHVSPAPLGSMRLCVQPYLSFLKKQEVDQKKRDSTTEADITYAGSVTFRMTLYNLETLAMEEILGEAGRTVSDTYRTSSSNTAV